MSSRGWALVTGAARRIGRALALSAAEAGYDVLVHHHASAKDASDTAKSISRRGRRSDIAAADLSDPSACERLISLAPGVVTLLVNCASSFSDDRIASLTPAGFDEAIALNLRAPLLLARSFAAALPPKRDALVVNIVDQRVWRLDPRFFSYTLSKAALWTATQTMAQAFAPWIRVNAIGPGPTLPSIHQSEADFAREVAAVPLGRGPDPGEVGQALRYLIDAPSVTGQMIAVDGGQHLGWRTPDILGD